MTDDQKNKSLIRSIEEQAESTLQSLRRLRELKAKQLDREKNLRQVEASLFEAFKEIIKGKKYFRLEHIDKLEVPYNIAIVLTAKNSGKTTELYREINRIIKRKERFIYGRVYKLELQSAIHQFEADATSPVVLLHSNGRFYFYTKEDVQRWRDMRMADDESPDLMEYCRNPRVTDMEKAGFKPVGLGYTFTNSNMLGGMNYEKYSTIIFDEILSYSPINRINDAVLHSWEASVSTIARNKPDIKIILCGNLLNVPEHPILDFYGVDVSDNLRVVRRGEKGECTILFVNAGGLYGGSFKNQAAATKHGDIERQAFLSDNKVIKTSTRVLDPVLFDSFEYETAFAVNMPDEAVFVELRSIEDKDDGVTYCVRCGNLKATTIMDGDIYTDDPAIYNKYENVTPRYDIRSVFNVPYRLYKTRSLYYDSLASLENYSAMLEKWKKTYSFSK